MTRKMSTQASRAVNNISPCVGRYQIQKEILQDTATNWDWFEKAKERWKSQS